MKIFIFAGLLNGQISMPICVFILVTNLSRVTFVENLSLKKETWTNTGLN